MLYVVHDEWAAVVNNGDNAVHLRICARSGAHWKIICLCENGSINWKACLEMGIVLENVISFIFTIRCVGAAGVPANIRWINGPPLFMSVYFGLFHFFFDQTLERV